MNLEALEKKFNDYTADLIQKNKKNIEDLESNYNRNNTELKAKNSAYV